MDLPNDRRPIENKWIFKKKTDADGNVTVYKARLIAKDFQQVQGFDYDETFSIVAMLKSVWIMLVKEICPRGNNKVVIYISLYHDKCLLFMLELY